MKELQQILTTFDDWLWGNLLLFVLLGVGLLIGAALNVDILSSGKFVGICHDKSRETFV